MKNIVTVLGYVKNLKRLLFILVGLSIATAAFGAIQPYGFKLIIDELVKATTHSGTNTNIIWLALLGLFVLRVLSSILSYYVNLIGNRAFSRVTLDLRDKIFQRLTTLSIDYFEKTRAGEIMQRAGANVTELANWFYGGSSNFLGQILGVLFALVLIFITDWRAGLLTMLAMIAFFTQQVPVLRKTRPMGRESRKHLERANGYLQETITHIATVRSFGGEAGATAQHHAAVSDWRSTQYDRLILLQNSILIRQTLTSIAIVGALAIVAYGAIHGTHTAGDILLVSLYMQQITNNIWSLGRFFVETNDVDITAERIVQMLETKSAVVDLPNAIKLDELKTIEFKDVSFAYPGKRRKVLAGISFRIEPGQTLALVGPSGTGKTTITKLLMRFYNPSSGQILINGQPIETFTQESVRRHMGVVMQDVALFNDTLESNLQLARPKARLSEVKAAAVQAHADVFIDKLPEKYKTLVGERGVKLSGGEKQRVAVARAILKDPQLIILDEATSALDSESEQHVQAGLAELMQGRAALVIAHRLSTVMRADQILVMDGGKIIERGTHATLATKRSGLYARLHKLQTEGYIKA